MLSSHAHAIQLGLGNMDNLDNKKIKKYSLKYNMVQEWGFLSFVSYHCPSLNQSYEVLCTLDNANYKTTYK